MNEGEEKNGRMTGNIQTRWLQGMAQRKYLTNSQDHRK